MKENQISSLDDPKKYILNQALIGCVPAPGPSSG